MARGRSRRILGLSKGQLAVAGVGGVALVGTLGYLLFGKSASAATSCWQVVTGPFTMTPGHYRLAMAVQQADQADIMSGWSQLPSVLSQVTSQLPGLTINGIWYGGLQYPAGTPVPSDWPGGAQSATLMADIVTAYSTAGSAQAAQALPAGMMVWKCSTGPTPAQQTLPANLSSILSGILASAQAAGAPAAGATKVSPVAINTAPLTGSSRFNVGNTYGTHQPLPVYANPV